VAGNKVPGIAIITSVVDAFPDVSNSVSMNWILIIVAIYMYIYTYVNIIA
jgi:hypothetical protein